MIPLPEDSYRFNSIDIVTHQQPDLTQRRVCFAFSLIRTTRNRYAERICKLRRRKKRPKTIMIDLCQRIGLVIVTATTREGQPKKR